MSPRLTCGRRRARVSLCLCLALGAALLLAQLHAQVHECAHLAVHGAATAAGSPTEEAPAANGDCASCLAGAVLAGMLAAAAIGPAAPHLTASAPAARPGAIGAIGVLRFHPARGPPGLQSAS